MCAGVLQADTQATLKRLSTETLMAVLRSDNLRVPSEMHVFRSVVSWLEADKSRLQQVLTLQIIAMPCPLLVTVSLTRGNSGRSRLTV